MCRISKIVQSCKILDAAWAHSAQSWQNEKCICFHSSNFLGRFIFFTHSFWQSSKICMIGNYQFVSESNSFFLFFFCSFFELSCFQYISHRWHDLMASQIKRNLPSFFSLFSRYGIHVIHSFVYDFGWWSSNVSMNQKFL